MENVIFGKDKQGTFKAIVMEPIAGRYTTEQEIMKKYWFFHPERTPQNGLMCFGFECDEGWYPLIDELCAKIEKVIDTKYPKFKMGEYPFEVIQVKEKYAGLRFYTNGDNDEIGKLIGEVEKKSYTICEICGEKGKVRDWGWLKTLCSKHWEEVKIKRGLK